MHTYSAAVLLTSCWALHTLLLVSTHEAVGRSKKGQRTGKGSEACTGTSSLAVCVCVTDWFFGRKEWTVATKGSSPQHLGALEARW